MREPLRDLRIVVTRSAQQAAELAAPLQGLGAKVILLPAIEIVPPTDIFALRDAANSVRDYDWIVFTSVNAVHAFARALRTGAGGIHPAIVCIGSATAQAAAAYGFRSTISPERYVAESVLPCFPSDMSGARVLIPRSALARDVIPNELRNRGADVTVVEAYRNVTPESTRSDAPEVFASAPDWVLFASSSAVDHMCETVPIETLAKSQLGSIGPVTSDALTKHGLTVAVEADPHTVEGLVDALRRFYAIRAQQTCPG